MPAALEAVVGLGAEERHAVLARRRLAALAVNLLLPLRELVVLLVLGERQEEPAGMQDVVALFDHVELQFAIGVGGGREDDRVEPRRHVPQVRDREDLRRCADFVEAFADARGLVEVELHAGGGNAAQGLDNIGDRPRRPERDADGRLNAVLDGREERGEVFHPGIVGGISRGRSSQ